MEQHGSALVFGGWADWSCPFELKYLQQPWDGMAFGAEVAFMRGGPGSMLRPATKTWGKSSPRLISSAADKDRRQVLLEAYLHRHDVQGTLDANGFSSIASEYYLDPQSM